MAVPDYILKREAARREGEVFYSINKPYYDALASEREAEALEKRRMQNVEAGFISIRDELEQPKPDTKETIDQLRLRMAFSPSTAFIPKDAKITLQKVDKPISQPEPVLAPKSGGLISNTLQALDTPVNINFPLEAEFGAFLAAKQVTADKQKQSVLPLTKLRGEANQLFVDYGLALPSTLKKPSTWATVAAFEIGGAYLGGTKIASLKIFNKPIKDIASKSLTYGLLGIEGFNVATKKKSLGTATGEFSAYMLSSSFVSPALKYGATKAKEATIKLSEIELELPKLIVGKKGMIGGKAARFRAGTISKAELRQRRSYRLFPSNRKIPEYGDYDFKRISTGDFKNLKKAYDVFEKQSLVTEKPVVGEFSKLPKDYTPTLIRTVPEKILKFNIDVSPKQIKAQKFQDSVTLTRTRGQFAFPNENLLSKTIDSVIPEKTLYINPIKRITKEVNVKVGTFYKFKRQPVQTDEGYLIAQKSFKKSNVPLYGKAPNKKVGNIIAMESGSNIALLQKEQPTLNFPKKYLTAEYSLAGEKTLFQMQSRMSGRKANDFGLINPGEPLPPITKSTSIERGFRPGQKEKLIGRIKEREFLKDLSNSLGILPGKEYNINLKIDTKAGNKFDYDTFNVPGIKTGLDFSSGLKKDERTGYAIKPRFDIGFKSDYVSKLASKYALDQALGFDIPSVPNTPRYDRGKGKGKKRPGFDFDIGFDGGFDFDISTPPPPSSPPPQPPPLNIIIPDLPEFPSFKKKKEKTSGKVKRAGSYIPSLVGVAFNIKQKNKKGLFTGLEIRGV